jgi:hypothetical protein
MPDEHKVPEPTPTAKVEEAAKPLTETEQMHKQALDQINEFKRLNQEERERKLAAIKKENDEIAAKASAKRVAVEKKRAVPPPDEEEGDKPPTEPA